jgi:transposase
MLVELGVVEQRYRAVLEVLEEGAPVVEVARRYGVARQTVHQWLARYANGGGLAGLGDRSSRPETCPHQMSPVVEARVVKFRSDHPGWGPSRIVWELERAGVEPLPGRSGVYRALVRHGLVEARKRRRRREDYRRWERGAAMELWQMDVMGRVHLASGTEVKVVTGVSFPFPLVKIQDTACREGDVPRRFPHRPCAAPLPGPGGALSDRRGGGPAVSRHRHGPARR